MEQSEILNNTLDSIRAYILASDRKAGFVVGLGGIALGWLLEKSGVIVAELGTAGFILAVSCMLVGMLCAIASVFPVLNADHDKRSLLYFGGVTEDYLSSGESIDTYVAGYATNIASNYEIALAEQVVTTSLIASRKYRLILISFVFSLFGFLLAVAGLVLYNI